ncbi:hypothetical protein OJ253_101 [Cryptosporidium canis]|uniref:Signal peptide-containing protein n=1 Tax=Cryptosporidium canis TaxID=195482 RepID=A0A9D5HZ12_9CRYT|nr:hypothetical protein OJ253_101 [Cryptosporidium canis]
MRNFSGFGYILLLIAFSLSAGAVHPGGPGYKTVYITKKKLPPRPVPERFRGELYSDGSIGWLSSRRTGSGWGDWTPVSESRVPVQMVRQLRSRVSRVPRGAPRIQMRRAAPLVSGGFDQDVSLEGAPHTSELQFTWEEEEEEEPRFPEDSPLELQPISPAPAPRARSYNMAAGRAPATAAYSVPRRRSAPAVMVRQRAQFRGSAEDESEIARYFEEQNAPPLAGRRGVREAFRGVFKGASPGLELASPVSERPARRPEGPSAGFPPTGLQQPSDYDLNRMQWRFFLTSFNRNLDNVRIVKQIPPLGMKLSKTVTECTNNYYKAFKLKYLTISGMVYSKKISRDVSNSISRELKQWCSGMMMSWYRQLQNMGLNVPKPSKFNR